MATSKAHSLFVATYTSCIQISRATKRGGQLGQFALVPTRLGAPIFTNVTSIMQKCFQPYPACPLLLISCIYSLFNHWCFPSFISIIIILFINLSLDLLLNRDVPIIGSVIRNTLYLLTFSYRYQIGSIMLSIKRYRIAYTHA